LSRDRCSGHAAVKNETKRLYTSRDALTGNFKRIAHITPAMHKRLFRMISVMTKSPRSAASAVRELQRAALNDLITALLRKCSAAQACSVRPIAVQTDVYIAAHSVILVTCELAVLSRWPEDEKLRFLVFSATSAACLIL